jgi:uncharacterized protein DUF4145
MGDQSEGPERIYCNKCRRKTLHRLLYTTGGERTDEYAADNWEPDGGDVPSCIYFDLLGCCGCNTAVLRRVFHCNDPEMHRKLGGTGKVVDEYEVYDDIRYFPPAVVRDLPLWRFKLPLDLRELLEEIYRSLDAQSLRLPMMGARTLVDMMIVEKIGDVGTFIDKLKELEKEGFVSARNRDALYVALEVGNATVHRSHVATEPEVQAVMEIVEGMLHAIYVFPELAIDLKKTMPARPPRPRKAP